MKEIFETLKPKNNILKRYIDYYYVDFKPNNEVHKYRCFPHFNNTISIYKSHQQKQHGTVEFDQNATALQIFTPIRTQVLDVTQIGAVHRIVIVFHPLGIQHFYANVNFSDYIYDYEFLAEHQLQQIFSTVDTNILIDLLDNHFASSFVPYQNPTLKESIAYVFKHTQSFSIAKMSVDLQKSRQHLTRVFQQHLGLSIKQFQNIVLFRKTIEDKLRDNPHIDFTELAYKFNFSDQSHLIKTYQNLAQVPPKAFFDQGQTVGEQDLFWAIKP